MLDEFNMGPWLVDAWEGADSRRWPGWFLPTFTHQLSTPIVHFNCPRVIKVGSDLDRHGVCLIIPARANSRATACQGANVTEASRRQARNQTEARQHRQLTISGRWTKVRYPGSAPQTTLGKSRTIPSFK